MTVPGFADFVAAHADTAVAWAPGQYLHDDPAPLVVTVALDHHDASPRWKEVVEPHPGTFVHHLEVRRVADIDDEVGTWLRAAWDAAA